MVSVKINRGDVLWVNLDPAVGTETKKVRPCVVISNNMANAFSSLITVLPITSKKISKVYPFEVPIEKSRSFEAGKILANQIRTIDRRRITNRAHRLDSITMKKVDRALALHLSLFVSSPLG